VMISLFDAAGRPVFVNREWERVLGWSLEDARGTDILSESYPDPERRREVLEFMQKAEGRWKDFKTRTRGGRLIDTSWVRVALSNGTRIGFGLDLSERKRLDSGPQNNRRYRNPMRLPDPFPRRQRFKRRAIPFAAVLLENDQNAHRTRASNLNFSTN